MEAVTGADDEIGTRSMMLRSCIVTALSNLEKGVVMLAIAADQSTGKGNEE